MDDSKHFIEEIIGRILLIVLAIVSASTRWWLPIVMAPLVWQFWEMTAGRRSRLTHPIAGCPMSFRHGGADDRASWSRQTRLGVTGKVLR